MVDLDYLSTIRFFDDFNINLNKTKDNETSMLG